jgi:hypothetical protein
MRLKACFSTGLLFAAALILTPPANAEQVPVPHIENGVARLRVVHAVNPRLPKVTDQELQALLAVMQQTVSDHFQIEVKLEGPVEIAVSDLLTAIPATIVTARKDIIYDFKTGTGDRDRLREGYVRTLRQWGTPLADLVAYAQPYLIRPVQKKSYKCPTAYGLLLKSAPCNKKEDKIIPTLVFAMKLAGQERNSM